MNPKPKISSIHTNSHSWIPIRRRRKKDFVKEKKYRNHSLNQSSCYFTKFHSFFAAASSVLPFHIHPLPLSDSLSLSICSQSLVLSAFCSFEDWKVCKEDQHNKVRRKSNHLNLFNLHHLHLYLYIHLHLHLHHHVLLLI